MKMEHDNFEDQIKKDGQLERGMEMNKKNPINITDPLKSWWAGDPRVEKFMPPIADAIMRHLPWPSEEYVDIYNRAYEAVYNAIVEYADKNAEIARLLAALSEIEKGEGAFSRDPLTHASNTIENMKRIAREAREKIGSKNEQSF